MRSRTRTSPKVAVAALAVACFVSVTSENLPVALVPRIAADLRVSEAAVGYLVTGYAAVVAVTAIQFVRLTAGWDRRRAALVAIGLVVGSNLLLAAAPSYAVAVIARTVAAAGHGVFWSIVAPIAARLVGEDRAGRATATIFAGNAMAVVLGLPVASVAGAVLGWRGAVTLMAVVAALAATALRLAVPAMPTGAGPASRSAEHLLRRNAPLLAVLAATLLLVTACFTAWTYVTLLIGRYVGVVGDGVAAMLLAHGVVGLAGVLVVRRSVDGRPRGTTVGVAAWFCGCMVVVVTVGSLSRVVAGAALVASALAAEGIGIVLQAAVLRCAPADPDRASAVYVVTFQVGIAAGAAVGGLAVAAGALPVVLVVAAGCAALAVPVILRARIAFPRRGVQAASPAERRPVRV